MTHYNKPPLTIEQHINQLEKRGLVITDPIVAEQYLTNIGYYRLSAYCLPFEQLNETEPSKRSHKFKKATKFDDILNLYIFDRKLRLLMMEAIERIEVAIRTQWANEMSLTHNDPHAFMNTELFNDPWKHQRQLAKVTNELKDSNEVFINHYKKHYNQPFLPPIWAMVEIITFGSLSQWYSNTKDNKLKAKIAKSLGMPTVEVMQGTLHSLTLIRNICAHHSRLWNRRFTMQLPAIRKLKQQMRIEEITTKSGDVQEQPRRELFNYIVVISHMMLKIQPDSSWTSRLLSHIQTLDLKQQVMMGFSADWQESDFIK